jgi:hypothetical protein
MSCEFEFNNKNSNHIDTQIGLNTKKKKRIILNLRGVKFEIILDNMDKIPDNRLAKLKKLIEDSSSPNLTFSNLNDEFLSLCDDYDLTNNEFFFNRNSIVFGLILDYYSTNRLHVDNNLCTRLILDEFNYWNIDERLIDKCCEWKYLNDEEAITSELNKRQEIIAKIFYKESFDNFYFGQIREKINYLVEKPSSSLCARIFFSFSVFMILLYTTASVVSTMPQFRMKDLTDSDYNKTLSTCLNSTTLKLCTFNLTTDMVRIYL